MCIRDSSQSEPQSPEGEPQGSQNDPEGPKNEPPSPLSTFGGSTIEENVASQQTRGSAIVLFLQQADWRTIGDSVLPAASGLARNRRECASYGLADEWKIGDSALPTASGLAENRRQFSLCSPEAPAQHHVHPNTDAHDEFITHIPTRIRRMFGPQQTQ